MATRFNSQPVGGQLNNPEVDYILIYTTIYTLKLARSNVAESKRC